VGPVRVSDLGDTGLGATIGAAIVGAIAAAREVFARKKRRTAPPELPEDESPTLAARVGRLYDRITNVEQEIRMLKQSVDTKLDKLDESVEELTRSRVRTDELLPLIRDQLREIRDELHQHRRATNKE
jgi:predicted  nucleic acid-binding Zn-ribbon protein